MIYQLHFLRALPEHVVLLQAVRRVQLIILETVAGARRGLRRILHQLLRNNVMLLALTVNIVGLKEFVRLRGPTAGGRHHRRGHGLHVNFRMECAAHHLIRNFHIFKHLALGVILGLLVVQPVGHIRV